MRIGINSLFLIPGQVGGTETYLRGLIEGLTKIDNQNEYILFTNRENHESFQLTASNFSKHLCDFNARFKLYRVFWEQVFFPRMIRNKKIDILHSPGYVSPMKVGCKTVVTIPDMQYRYYPQNFNNSRLWYWQYFIPRSANQANRIITLSNHSKTDIINLLQVPQEKISVTYCSSKYQGNNRISEELATQTLSKYGIRDNFILSVGSLLPHKNLDRLIEAYSQLKDQIDEQLVLVGLKIDGYNALRAKIKQLNVDKNRILVLGYIPDTDLIALYQQARLFVFPSLFEGFGIPVLESMTFGCPVVASNRTAIPEVIGDAGCLFNPESTTEIAESIMRVVSDEHLRTELIQKGNTRVNRFSWARMAAETIAVYRLAVK